MANLLTGCRIVCSMLMLLFPVPSIWFAAMYLLGGLTDMLDGFIARRTHTASRLGARLDTAADFLFLASALCRLWPFLVLPAWLWIWTAVIAAVKIINVLSGLICHKAFVAVHSVMNKVTGGTPVSVSPNVASHGYPLERRHRLRRCHLCGDSGRALYPHRTRYRIDRPALG